MAGRTLGQTRDLKGFQVESSDPSEESLKIIFFPVPESANKNVKILETLLIHISIA